VTVADPVEIGCEECGADPGVECFTKGAGKTREPHAIRWADSRLPEVMPGWIPEPDRDLAVVLDFGAARLRKMAQQNGVSL
jgi:hypothetical protein